MCLVTRRSAVLFCTVAEKSPRSKSEGHADGDDRGSPWKDSKSASVVLTLVNFSHADIRVVVDLFYSKSSVSLVEFPGVLLTAFEPTLEALKQMNDVGIIHFSELLIAWSQGASKSDLLTPPVYSLALGFVFNLRCLMINDADFYDYPNQEVNFRLLCENSSLDNS